MRKPNKMLSSLLSLILILSLAACGSQVEVDVGAGVSDKINSDTTVIEPNINTEAEIYDTSTSKESLNNQLIFNGDPFILVNNNEPSFNNYTTEFGTEVYAELDNLGRCGEAYAVVGPETMPTEDRGDISKIKPTGWHSGAPANWNRCHLIGFQLTGENANEKNLITGTRYLNIEGMLPFENMIADYVKETGNHVQYKVTPVYNGNNLVADGVYMEGYSMEDSGEGISFNVYCFNAAPGVVIDYVTGESYEIGVDEIPENLNLDENSSSVNAENNTPDITVNNTDIKAYILNTSSKKIHTEDCSSAAKTKDENKEMYEGSISSLLKEGYEACGICNPN